MPLFYQQDINASTRLGVWKIEEDEAFFLDRVPSHRQITHPHKKLQHLAGRYLLQLLFPDFPYDLIQIADTRKPFLPDEQYHFSISHSGDYAAAIVSSDRRVGVDVELYSEKVMKVLHKFLDEDEMALLRIPGSGPYEAETLFWSVKESMFKWHGCGDVDFRKHLRILSFNRPGTDNASLQCEFRGDVTRELILEYRLFNELCVSWVSTQTS
jgi:phosphopantetheinyl transferase